MDSTNATLTPLESAERWCAILEAAAFSPIRSLIKPMGRPDVVADELLATVKRLAPAIPKIAELFGIEVADGAAMPKPLRPTRPGRDKTEKKGDRPARGERRAKKGASASATEDESKSDQAPASTEPTSDATTEPVAIEEPTPETIGDVPSSELNVEETAADDASVADDPSGNTATDTDDGAAETSTTVDDAPSDSDPLG